MITHEGSDHLALLEQVAYLYYERNLTQAEIAKLFGISRSSISRLLNEARERGVVEIRIHYSTPRDFELEAEFKKRFQLSSIYILRSQAIPQSAHLPRIAKLAADHIENRLHPGLIFGLSWGTALYETVHALKARSLPGTRVVQFIGAIGRGNLQIDGPELARQLAQTLEAEHYSLHAPLVVANEEACQALLSERTIEETLALARRADLALVGIGSTEPAASSLIRAGYLEVEELNAIRQQGAVGDICARHFDIQGNLLDLDINRRVVGINLEELQSLPEVVGVAGGKVKAPAILGALQGGYIDTLVTDDIAAQEVLSLADRS